MEDTGLRRTATEAAPAPAWPAQFKRVLRAAGLALAYIAFLAAAAVMLAGTGVIHLRGGG